MSSIEQVQLGLGEIAEVSPALSLRACNHPEVPIR